MIQELSVTSTSREQMIDITRIISDVVAESGITSGAVVCYVPHTTAALTINEDADPDVPRDLIYKLRKEIPQKDGYHHGEGNSDAHLKSSLFGCSETILIDQGQLVLGQWQSLFFCEFDGPRNRRLIVKVI